MQMLTLAELITRCSLVGAPEGAHVNDMLYRVVEATSRGDVYAVTDATTGEVHHSGDLERASALVERLEGAGHDTRLGLAGVSLRDARTLGYTPAETFEPCTQIGIASAALERVLTPKARKSTATLHIALATYWSPRNHEDLQAIEWGARVLSTPRVDVDELDERASSGRALEPQIYPAGSGIFFGAGRPKPRKWEALK